MRQLALGDEAVLPFPTQTFGRKGLYKLFGVVTSHARKLIVRLGGGAKALATSLDARHAIRALAEGPAG